MSLNGSITLCIMILSEIRKGTDVTSIAGVIPGIMSVVEIGLVQLQPPAHLKDKVSNGTGNGSSF